MIIGHINEKMRRKGIAMRDFGQKILGIPSFNTTNITKSTLKLGHLRFPYLSPFIITFFFLFHGTAVYSNKRSCLEGNGTGYHSYYQILKSVGFTLIYLFLVSPYIIWLPNKTERVIPRLKTVLNRKR